MSISSLTACYNPLGMESHEIWDGDITANYYKTEYFPYKARLNAKSGWLAYYYRPRPLFIQAKVGRGEFTVTGVATQVLDSAHYVESFTLSHSLDGIDWVDYREDGEVKVGD